MSDFEIKWEDEEEDLSPQKSQQQEMSFEQMLAEDDFSEEDWEVGQKVTATIVAIPEASEEVTLELGRKSSASISKADLFDENGVLQKKIGDKIDAFIVSMDAGEIFLSNSMSHSFARDQALDTAFATKLPVKGKVAGINKGGFEVNVMGKKAFCPVSQMDRKFVANKELYIGREYDFLITKKEGNHNIVVSRAALLEKAAEEAIKSLKKILAENQDAKVDGIVEEIRDIGAMIDLGGVTGMVHISEAGHGRLGSLHDVLKVGDKIKVKVLTIDETGQRPKIALSIKATLEDPWDVIETWFSEGESYLGKVVRLEAFGAFVELRPGIEGLIHVSEMSWMKRIRHPKDVLKNGDQVSVRILSIDKHNRRISLTMKSIEQDPWFEIEKKFPLGSEKTLKVENLKAAGASFKLAEGVEALLLSGTLKKAFGDSYRNKSTPGKELTVKIADIDINRRRIILTLPDMDDDKEEIKQYHEYMEKQKLQEKAPRKPQSMGSFGELLQKSLTKK